MTQLEKLLSFFEVSGDDSDYVYHDIREGYHAEYSVDEVIVVGVPKKGSVYQVCGPEFGTIECDINTLISRLDIFQKEKVF